MLHKIILVVLFVLPFSLASLAQEANPLEVVQAQLDTYNHHDIDGFSALFAKDAEIFMNIGDAEPSMKGRAQIKERYGKMFEENPQNKSTLMGRMVQGNFVFDHEWITGRDNEFKIMAIYEVENGLIVRAWFVR